MNLNLWLYYNPQKISLFLKKIIINILDRFYYWYSSPLFCYCGWCCFISFFANCFCGIRGICGIFVVLLNLCSGVFLYSFVSIISVFLWNDSFMFLWDTLFNLFGLSLGLLFLLVSPAGNYMFKINNRNTRTKCEICSKLTIIVNFQHISHLVLVFLLLASSR